MSNLDEYKVKHLLLLVGGNPLPNYVAARTLLEDEGTVYLIYSNNTSRQQEWLEECLEDAWVDDSKSIESISLYNYEADGYHISKTIKEEILNPLLNSVERVGLNYTGGTKAMAVHAYRAVQELKPDSVFSYLDSRRLKMCIDRKNNEPTREVISLELSLEELFKLHDLKWQDKQPPSTEPTLSDSSAKFAGFYQNKELAEAWKGWCETEEFKQKRELIRKYKKNKLETELKKQPILKLSNLPEQIKKILSDHLAASSEELSLIDAQNKGFKKLKHIVEWLHGTWLEDYVLQQVKEVAKQKEFPINNLGMSFHIIQNNQKSNNEKFEFDVAFMLGYQLFAISCTTTDSKTLCKSKLFEAYIRARQLGGDEARVALVCCYDKPGVLEEELRTTIADPKIKVFGRTDLPNLAREISDWIKQNNRDLN